MTTELSLRAEIHDAELELATLTRAYIKAMPAGKVRAAAAKRAHYLRALVHRRRAHALLHPAETRVINLQPCLNGEWLFSGDPEDVRTAKRIGLPLLSGSYVMLPKCWMDTPADKFGIARGYRQIAEECGVELVRFEA